MDQEQTDRIITAAETLAEAASRVVDPSGWEDEGVAREDLRRALQAYWDAKAVAP